jgi:DNA-binding winged helix-turn-helix (wHTH) protein/tetratricopeptide (TPR) repeat protein
MTAVIPRPTWKGLKSASRKNQFGINSSMPLKTIESVRFYDYSVDRVNWSVQWQGEPIALSRKSFDLLLYLIDHRDRVVSKDELLEKLWPEQFIEESNLTQHIFLLRKALSRHEAGQKIILTVSGRGYRFNAPVIEADEPTEEMVLSATESITRITVEEEEDDSAALAAPAELLSAAPVGLRRKRLALIAAAALVALAAGGWFGWQRWLDRTAGPPVTVVLSSMEGTTGDAVLDQALTNALRVDLAQSPFVSLLSLSAVRSALVQMTQKPDATVTPVLAREICERNGSQAVVRSAVVRVGQQFLITAEASNCVDGSALGQAKYEADRLEDLPHGIDQVAATLRQRLGESRRSIARFSTPLFPMNTVSLDALKAATQGEQDTIRGHTADAIGLFQRAIAADPQFASAYYDLAAVYASAGDFPHEREAIAKAFELKDFAGKPSQFAITALYTSAVTQDLYAAERNYRSWTELYPKSPQAWNGLSVVQAALGDHAGAAASCARALALVPNHQGLYVDLADNQMRSGDLQAARSTLDHAIAANLDGDRIRNTFLTLATLLHDVPLIQEQKVWIEAHPEAPYSLITEMEMADGEGRFSEARRLLEKTVHVLHKQGLDDFANALSQNEGLELIEAGDVEEGSRLFHSKPIDPKNGQQIAGLAAEGNIADAEKYLKAVLAKYPDGTLWKSYWTPKIRAEEALAMHKPAEAAALLETTRAFDGRNLDVWKLRGDAYLAAGQPAMAEKEYRYATAHPYLDSTGIDVSLSWLGLARSLRAEGNRSGAIDAYQLFLALWAHADPDAVYLKQAKLELSGI